jgi:hypothetical protein
LRDLGPVNRRGLDSDCVACHSCELVLPKPSQSCLARLNTNIFGHCSTADCNRFVGGKALKCLGESGPDEEDVAWPEDDFFFFGDTFNKI